MPDESPPTPVILPRMTRVNDLLARDARVTLLAPHPDDESLAAGGLIQQAVASGADVRVIFATDGDNNPWPQRWVERRWRIDAGCRRRWGEQRRAEARRALGILGVPEARMEFFGLPDAGLLRLWRRRDETARGRFIRVFRDRPPSLLILPSPGDRHPDHQGAFHFATEALRRLGQRPALFSYLIHPGWFRFEPSGFPLHLTREQQAAKRQAILCHETQTSLSRGRFSSYAMSEELFMPEPW